MAAERIAEMNTPSFRNLFSPVSIGACRIKNRYCMAPMGNFGMTDAEGLLTEEGTAYYARRAQGGCGLIITGMFIVEDRFEKNRVTGIPLFSASVNHERLKKRMRELTDRVHTFDCRIFLQLSAGFGRASHIGLFCDGAVAPSEVANRFRPDILHRALTSDEIHTYVESFAREAAYAKEYGFDGIEVHALHEGYLLDQFATECFNRRTDAYGGSFENRYRFAVEIREAIAASCGASFPVSLRYSPKHYMKGVGEGALPGEDFIEAGRDMPEGIEATSYLADKGYDAFDVDLGCYDAHFWSHPPVYFEDGMYLAGARAVKQAVDVPVLVSGRMDDPGMGETAIKNGDCDMVALGRPLLADPDLPRKVQTGKEAQIRPCISCNVGCTQRIRETGCVECAVNAECGRETKRFFIPAPKQKKVLVVGGGIAGMEYARVSALRGHQVTLSEASDVLGGQLLPGGCAPFKRHDHALIHYYEQELQCLGVNVRLHEPVTREKILAFHADLVAVATGAVPRIPSVPGGDKAHVMSAVTLLTKIERAGNKIVIAGAGQVGVELALWLGSMGKQVTLVEQADTVMRGAYHNAVIMATLLLRQYQVHILCETVLEEIQDTAVKLRMKNGEAQMTDADTVIWAVGFAAEHTLYDSLLETDVPVVLLGDARSPRNVYEAVHSAYETAYRDVF